MSHTSASDCLYNVELVLACLDSESGPRRAEAKRILRDHGPDVVPGIAALLRGGRRWRPSGLVRLAQGFLVPGAVFIVFVAMLLPEANRSVVSTSLVGAWFLCLTGIAATRMRAERAERRQKVLGRAERAVALIEDPAAVEPIVEMIEPTSVYAIPRPAEHALIRLLPRIAAQNAELLPSHTRLRLGQILDVENVREHIGLLIEVLGALGRVGDVARLPAVQRLADAHPTTEDHVSVGKAAIVCARRLTECADRLRQGRTLLRPAEDPIQQADLLLRPAAQADSDLGQLLRPAERNG